MRRIKLILFISAILITGIVNGQKFVTDTISFPELPDTLKGQILMNVNRLLNTDTISSSFSYIKNGNSHTYSYKLYLQDNQLFGTYTHFRQCTDCMFNEISATIVAHVLYCCKDSHHNPNESARTRLEMIAIQNKNHCSKIGLCIID